MKTPVGFGLLFGTLVLLGPPSPISAQSPPKFPETAIKGWTDQQAELSGLRGRFNRVHTAKAEGVEEQRIERAYEFGTGGDGVSFKLEKDGQVQVAAVNPEYGFTAGRSGEGAKYELDQFRTGKLMRQVEAEVRESFEPFLFARFQISGIKLANLVQSPHFRLLTLSEDANNKTAVATFEYTPPDDQRDTAITGGKVNFDLERGWAIESFDCTTVWGKTDGKVTYRQFADTIVPASYEVRLHGANNSLVVDRYELMEIEPLASGTGPIHLADYGLPAPNRLTPTRDPSPPIPWVLIGNAALILVLLLAFWIFRRRARGEQAARP